MNKATSNIARLRELGFTVEKTPEHVAIGCVWVKYHEPFYYVNRRYRSDIQQNIRSVSMFDDFVEYAQGGQLIFSECSLEETDIPFAILKRELYTQITYQIHDIMMLNEKINQLKRKTEEHKNAIFDMF